MISKSQIAHLCLSMFLLLPLAAAPAYAGPTMIGLVKGSTNASVGGQALLPDTALFSGDRLEVNDGVAVVVLGSTSRMTFYRDTVASFLRDSGQVTVLLGQGAVSLFHAESSATVRVKVGEISVVPVSAFETLGEVAAGNGVVTVNARDGRLLVVGNGQAIIVAKGETVTLEVRAHAPKSARESGVAKPSLPSLQSAPQPSPLYIRGAGPAEGGSSASASGLSHEGAAKADASGVALYTALFALSPPVAAPVKADTVGRALHPLAALKCPISPHKPK